MPQWRTRPRPDGARARAPINPKPGLPLSSSSQLLGAGLRFPGAAAKWDFHTQEAKVGQWHHVALVYDAAQNVSYFLVDGQTQSHIYSPGKGPVQATANPLYIGAADANTEFFVGFVQNVRVYDRALNTSELTALSAELATMDTHCMYYDTVCRGGGCWVRGREGSASSFANPQGWHEAMVWWGLGGGGGQDCG